MSANYDEETICLKISTEKPKSNNMHDLLQ